MGDQRAQRVQGIEQRALVVIQVAVDHLPPRHALADGKVDVGVGPVVDGVAKGGLGAKSFDWEKKNIAAAAISSA